MIPPFLATMFAKPLVKWGSIAGLIVVLSLSAYGWKQYQRYVGREQQKEKQRVEQMHQQQQAIVQTMKQLELSQKKATEIEQEKETWRRKALKVQEEKEKYVRYTEAKTLDPGVVDLVNQFARVLNHATSDQRMSATSTTPAESSVESQAPATTVDAFDRLDELTTRLADCEQTHKGLSEWALDQYREATETYMRNGHLRD